MPKTELTKSSRQPLCVRATSFPTCAMRWIVYSSASRAPSRAGRRNGAITLPELDVRENTNSIVIEVELPSVDEEGRLCHIKGEKKHEKEEKGENYYLA